MQATESRESGFSLIELVVYAMLLVLVVGVAGSMVTGLINNTLRVTALNQATSVGQLAIDSIDSSIRNSSDFQLTSPSGTDQLLIARAASTSGPLSWGCVAWYYSAAGAGSIRSMRSTAPILPPTATELATWTLLDDGVQPLTGTTIFSTTARQVTVSFTSAAGGQTPVGITSAALSRAGASGAVSCF